MEDLEDELDLRYHRGLKPEVYYRIPTLESLDGALRNELDKNAASLIPVEIVTEFVFAVASTITIPVAQQSALDALIEPADHLQSMTVAYALCRDIDGKDRLKIQRAIARSIIAAIEEADGFKYTERSAQSKEGGDGARLKYVCKDSMQNRDRKGHMKKENEMEMNSEDSEDQTNKRGRPRLPTYDCGGAIHIKFSLKREAINVVYKHNLIHSSLVTDESPPPVAREADATHTPGNKSANGTKERKSRAKKKASVDVSNEYHDPDMDMSTSPEAPNTKKKRKKNASLTSPDTSRKSATKKTKSGKETTSLSARKKTQIRDTSPPPVPVKGKACIRCREKKIKCNEAKPTCNQCRRGLWTCQYELPGVKKRSKNGCVNCKNRKRKCTEEQPSCAHCLRLDDDCEHVDYS